VVFEDYFYQKKKEKKVQIYLPDQSFRVHVLCGTVNFIVARIYIVDGSGSCRAAPCSAVRGPFDHFKIRVSTNLKVIERSTCYAAQCHAGADLVP
jgi:hypothetical protein